MENRAHSALSSAGYVNNAQANGQLIEFNRCIDFDTCWHFVCIFAHHFLDVCSIRMCYMLHF